VYQNPNTIPIIVGSTLSSQDVRREKEIELEKNDALWRERMTKLEETLQKTNTIMEEQYSTALNNVRSRFAKAPPSHQLPPCQDLKAQLLACYRANPGQTLMCAQEVAMFRDCVSAHRFQKLDKDDQQPDATSASPAKKVAKGG